MLQSSDRPQVLRIAATLRTLCLVTASAVYLTACATIGGAAIGAGIGAIAGDPRTGMAVGASTGAVIDIFGR